MSTPHSRRPAHRPAIGFTIFVLAGLALALGNLGAAQAPADAVPSHATSSFQAPTASHSGSQAPAPAATASSSLSRDLQWRNIGPANMAGRVTDIEALDADPATVLVASASGGVFKSTNAGTTWKPIFDKYGAASIGDIAIFQKNPNIIWVGTGESCVRNSVAWGDGVYKSTDGGKTFTNVGLRDTHHIGEVVTHPTDPNIVVRRGAGTPVGLHRRARRSSRRSTAARRGRSSRAACPTTGRRVRPT